MSISSTFLGTVNALTVTTVLLTTGTAIASEHKQDRLPVTDSNAELLNQTFLNKAQADISVCTADGGVKVFGSLSLSAKKKQITASLRRNPDQHFKAINKTLQQARTKLRFQISNTYQMPLLEGHGGINSLTKSFSAASIKHEDGFTIPVKINFRLKSIDPGEDHGCIKKPYI